MIHSQDLPSNDESKGKPFDGKAAANTEEHVLRRLGAAVTLHWSTIPKKLRRELFDTAGSLGDVLQTAILRGQAARFLHHHKDERVSTDGISKSDMVKRNALITFSRKRRARRRVRWAHDRMPRPWA